MSEIINENNNNFSLEKFNPLIQEVESKTSMYMSLSISWLDDKENIDVVQKAKMEVVRLRTSIEKDAKAIRDPHTQFNNLVSQKEKEMLARLLPVEEHLKAEQEKVKQLKLQKEKEEQEKQKKIFQERINKLSSIWHTPGNFFAIWNMKDDEFEKYYNEIKEENEIKEKIQIGLNMISSCLSLEELEELHHNDSFLETYQTQQFKEAFEKRFNEITVEEENKKRERVLNLINKINSSTLEEVMNIETNEPEVEEVKKNRISFLIQINEQKQINESIIKINSSKTLEELKSIKDLFDVEQVRLAYNMRVQFLEQQEEMNKMKKEQEKIEQEQRKKEQEEREQEQKRLQEENRKKQEREKNKQNFIIHIMNISSQEELVKLFSNNNFWDLLEELKPYFTKRKQDLIQIEEREKQRKAFQEYTVSIWYNNQTWITKDNWDEILIYNLIWKWKKN